MGGLGFHLFNRRFTVSAGMQLTLTSQLIASSFFGALAGILSVFNMERTSHANYFRNFWFSRQQLIALAMDLAISAENYLVIVQAMGNGKWEMGNGKLL